jgi:hypothetical protein
MSDPIVPILVNREFALQTIRRLVAEGKFAIEQHAREAMSDPERNVPMRLVLETLKGGSIDQGPKLDEYGEWRCRLRRRCAGKVVRVVVALAGTHRLCVVTVF